MNPIGGRIVYVAPVFRPCEFDGAPHGARGCGGVIGYQVHCFRVSDGQWSQSGLIWDTRELARKGAARLRATMRKRLRAKEEA